MLNNSYNVIYCGEPRKNVEIIKPSRFFFAILTTMIYMWHSFLGMKKYDLEWHLQDLADELSEYHEPQNMLKKWSELSDVVYTCTRGEWSGHSIVFPFSRWMFFLGSIYMFPKYTARWMFFRRAGEKMNPNIIIREVRNPKKVNKLHNIAEMYNLDPNKFQIICEQQLKVWPLLP